MSPSNSIERRLDGAPRLAAVGVAALCAALAGLVGWDALADRPAPWKIAGAPAVEAEEPITPVPPPPPSDPAQIALGERLFHDVRLSARNTASCSSCHDITTNGASRIRASGEGQQFDVLTVFNAAQSFRLDWEGGFRTLEDHAEFSLCVSERMGGDLNRIVAMLAADPSMVAAFEAAYGGAPSRKSLLSALATFQQSLLTPGARFDRWLEGNDDALSEVERAGYQAFKSLGCISCHQGVNIGGNLFQRHGVFAPLASPKPEILRVPSLRNVATTAPYFHDGSAPTLEDAVRRMARSQLNVKLEEDQVAELTAFLNTLTGEYKGEPVKPPAEP
ncbi:MAG: cytochrome c peroxidase [Hansschlegelia sp.]